MVEIENQEELKIAKPSIMICLPTKGEMKTKTSDCLMRTFIKTMNAGIKCTITYAEGTLVSAVRSVLVKAFLESDFTHLFFIDSDMVFQDDLVLQLLEMNKDIACGVAKVRGGKNYNIYHWVPQQEKYAPVSQINMPAIIEIDNTGCSCVLIRRKVFEDVVNGKKAMQEKFKKWKIESADPFEQQMLFNLMHDEVAFTALGEKSEDMIFFELARSKGYKIFCNLGLQLGHICEETLQ